MTLNVKRLKFHFNVKQWLIVLSLGFTLNFTCQASHQKELITDLHSKIVIHQDATLTVTETIKVNVQHEQIKRGITRSFPTRYKNKYGANVVVDFKVENITLDGRKCPYRIVQVKNGELILFGNEQLIEKGEHTYQITYRTNRQLTFTKDWIELYFNIVGNDVVFPIIKATAEVYLPTQIDPEKIELEGYTGYYGQQFKNYAAKIYKSNICQFQTTRTLLPQQSFTISVAFPAKMSGITAPTWWMSCQWFFKDNLSLIILFLCILFLLIIYLRAAYQINKNRPVIMPLFTPPVHLSPADCAFLYHKHFNNIALTATMVDMAVAGYLKIRSHAEGFLGKNSYTLIKNDQHIAELNPQYDCFSNMLFNRNNELKLGQANYQFFNKFTSKLKSDTSIKNNAHIIACENTIFGGVIISILSVFSAMYYQQLDFILIPILIIIAINIIAGSKLKDYTPQGKKLYAQIAGFRMFLNYAEKDRIERLNPPTITSEIFEKYLPYAIALGVDQAWTDHFNSIYIQMATSDYHPFWFTGRHFKLKNFSNEIQNFNSALTQTITAPLKAPGTSSGRGGSGFSGGGGGGGGIGGR